MHTSVLSYSAILDAESPLLSLQRHREKAAGGGVNSNNNNCRFAGRGVCPRIMQASMKDCTTGVNPKLRCAACHRESPTRQTSYGQPQEASLTYGLSVAPSGILLETGRLLDLLQQCPATLLLSEEVILLASGWREMFVRSKRAAQAVASDSYRVVKVKSCSTYKRHLRANEEAHTCVEVKRRSWSQAWRLAGQRLQGWNPREELALVK